MLLLAKPPNAVKRRADLKILAKAAYLRRIKAF